jgi:cell wall-associated NlpC family hydrolase
MFFGPAKDPDYNNITHVGMVIDRKRFVHSCDILGVCVSPIDDDYFTSIYWGARRMRLDTLDAGGGAPED